jgi:hypothetical protein
VLRLRSQVPVLACHNVNGPSSCAAIHSGHRLPANRKSCLISHLALRSGLTIWSSDSTCDLIQRMEVTDLAAQSSDSDAMTYDEAAVDAGGKLAELVRNYNICCEVRPKYLGAGGARRQVGFDLELLGSHSSDRYHLDPTCQMCELVRGALLAVTGRIVPRSGGFVRYDVNAHLNSVIWTSALGNRPFVTLSIRILDGQRFAPPMDPNQIAPLIQIREHLEELGIREA